MRHVRDLISGGIAEQMKVIEVPIQSDYDSYKCGQYRKMVLGHDRENHSKENHHGQAEWNKLKK
jgi:hypothetical protein